MSETVVLLEPSQYVSHVTRVYKQSLGNFVTEVLKNEKSEGGT